MQVGPDYGPKGDEPKGKGKLVGKNNKAIPSEAQCSSPKSGPTSQGRLAINKELNKNKEGFNVGPLRVAQVTLDETYDGNSLGDIGGQSSMELEAGGDELEDRGRRERPPVGEIRIQDD
ncbi:OLC1v1030755C1 [Oldenlandia corymbosa var. corymbosa]|uniref:OLC1v1030755C1 n=1 Tax=Oldenlandia corymbosa var. corymbosa TaxID=529605 RepID=A0AAV1CGT9_OLDCO|nr:OLC1v1030755C1 [Oldenlandia corymbosa var. corymbosa]